MSFPIIKRAKKHDSCDCCCDEPSNMFKISRIKDERLSRAKRTKAFLVELRSNTSQTVGDTVYALVPIDNYRRALNAMQKDAEGDVDGSNV